MKAPRPMASNQYSARSILEVLNARGISDVALAKQTGINRVTLNRIRHGKESGKNSLPVLRQLIVEKSLKPHERAILERSFKVETLDTSEVQPVAKNEREKAPSDGFFKKLWSSYRESVSERERRLKYEEKRLENARKLVERADKRERAKQALAEIEQQMRAATETTYVTQATYQTETEIEDTLALLNHPKRTGTFSSPVTLPTSGYMCAVCNIGIGTRTPHSLAYSKGKEVHVCANCATIPKYQKWLYEHRNQ